MGHRSPLQLVLCAGDRDGGGARRGARRRFTAMLLVGVTGYGIAMMFVLTARPTWR